MGDWSEVSEGMIVEARVTGHNKGGLECEVNRLRGFIPASQISLYRVEDLAQFVGQKFACVITEANPDKGNLVLSRRAVLEREKAEAKTKLLAELEVGQVREGIVRSLQEFGAFVDLGGVDGLIHISQLSWDRIRHASEVLELGQKVKVKIQKIDPAHRQDRPGVPRSGRESLGERRAASIRRAARVPGHGDAAHGVRRVRAAGGGHRRADSHLRAVAPARVSRQRHRAAKAKKSKCWCCRSTPKSSGSACRSRRSKPVPAGQGRRG